MDFSIGTLDPDVWSRSEPGTPHPRKRLDAVRRLNERGIPSGVLMAPIIPGLTDRPEQIEAVVKGAAEAQARFITGSYLHLRGPLKDHYLGWVEQEYPHLMRHYRHVYGERSYGPGGYAQAARRAGTPLRGQAWRAGEGTWTEENPAVRTGLGRATRPSSLNYLLRDPVRPRRGDPGTGPAMSVSRPPEPFPRLRRWPPPGTRSRTARRPGTCRRSPCRSGHDRTAR